MRGQRITLLCLASAVLGLAAVPSSAMACSCAQPDVKELLRTSDGAMIGKLLSVRRLGADPPAGEPVGPRRAVFRYRVKAVFKGRIVSGRALSVFSIDDGAACGLPQGVGRSYGLFLTRGSGRWSSNLCSVVGPRALRDGASRRPAPC